MEFVGFMNSVQVYCLQKNGSTIAAKKKKKKTEEMHNTNKCYPN